MHHERKKPQFSDAERDEIRISSRRIAQMGPEAIRDLLAAKWRLCVLAYNTVDSIPDIDQKMSLARALAHDVTVVDEVLRQARTIRQIEGVDELNELDRASQEAGMGSIFDESSEMYKKLKEHLR